MAWLLVDVHLEILVVPEEAAALLVDGVVLLVSLSPKQLQTQQQPSESCKVLNRKHENILTTFKIFSSLLYG